LIGIAHVRPPVSQVSDPLSLVVWLGLQPFFAAALRAKNSSIMRAGSPDP
jgi:hypothetical protein